MEKAYDRVNREALWQALRMYDVGSKRLRGIQSIYVESEQGCIMSPWLFDVYMDGVKKEVKMEMGRRE